MGYIIAECPCLVDTHWFTTVKSPPFPLLLADDVTRLYSNALMRVACDDGVTPALYVLDTHASTAPPPTSGAENL